MVGSIPGRTDSAWKGTVVQKGITCSWSVERFLECDQRHSYVSVGEHVRESDE